MKAKLQVSLAGSLLMISVLAITLLAQGLVPTTSTTTLTTTSNAPAPTPASTGFDNKTNGFLSQALFDSAADTFKETETVEDGVGPLFNATSCADCHHTPALGGGSQITELRAGRYDGSTFTPHVGGSLINDRALDASILETVAEQNNVRTFRGSISTLGDGYIEAIADGTLLAIAAGQPLSMRGQAIQVPINESNGAMRVGRFGWKNQHASLESFAADAYLNEMGITSPMQPVENTSNGKSVALYDTVSDPEDSGEDVLLFANFMRSTKAPSRDETLAATPDAVAGRVTFTQIGCDTCHVARLVTAPAGTSINGGAFVVPPALGNKVIHPFSDYLLHDIGTGDGIVQNGGPSSMNKVRTAPLWGLRTRSRLMHDGASVSPNDAILRHKGEAQPVLNRYLRLTPQDKRQVLTFLESL